VGWDRVGWRWRWSCAGPFGFPLSSSSTHSLFPRTLDQCSSLGLDARVVLPCYGCLPLIEAVLMLLIQVPGPCLFFPFSSFSLPSWPPFVVPYQLPPSTMAMTPGPTIWVRRIWSWSGRELGSNVSNTCGLPQVGV